MSESTTEKAVTAEPVETGNSVQQVAQEPSGPGNRQGGGEWPDPDTPPKGLVEYDPQRVPLNMYETTEALVLVLPLPGVMADDVTIDIEDDRVHDVDRDVVGHDAGEREDQDQRLVGLVHVHRHPLRV